MHPPAGHHPGSGPRAEGVARQQGAAHRPGGSLPSSCSISPRGEPRFVQNRGEASRPLTIRDRISGQARGLLHITAPAQFSPGQSGRTQRNGLDPAATARLRLWTPGSSEAVGQAAERRLWANDSFVRKNSAVAVLYCRIQQCPFLGLWTSSPSWPNRPLPSGMWWHSCCRDDARITTCALGGGGQTSASFHRRRTEHSAPAWSGGIKNNSASKDAGGREDRPHGRETAPRSFFSLQGYVCQWSPHSGNH